MHGDLGGLARSDRIVYHDLVGRTSSNIHTESINSGKVNQRLLQV